MILFFLLFVATLFLAYANGANDNFKGVATLFGSRTTNYRWALGWATGTTFLGSLASIYLADTLVKRFSGKGLVPAAVAGSPEFLLAVALGATLTVMLATRFGLPISTTHSLSGALVGAGWMAVGSALNVRLMGQVFFLPLLVSPFIAILLSFVMYLLFRFARVTCGVKKEWCVCVGKTEQVIPMPQPRPSEVMSFAKVSSLGASVDTVAHCEERYQGRFLGISVQRLIDLAHVASGGVVSFARGLNDTPKIVGLLLVVRAFSLQYGMLAVALAMAIGGLLQARRVAHTISQKITPMNHGQGFTANLMTGFLVIVASRLGVPVSTTHVSVGSLFGVGLVTREGNRLVISEILLSWLLTLPIAASLAAMIYGLQQLR